LLTALLLDAKTEAGQLKQAGDKAKLKEVSKKIKDYVVGVYWTYFKLHLPTCQQRTKKAG